MTLEEFKKNHPDVANAYKTEILAGAKDNAGADTQAAADTERARRRLMKLHCQGLRIWQTRQSMKSL